MPTVTVSNDCICCGECGEACPRKLMQPLPTGGKGYAQYHCVDEPECLGCGVCVSACDQRAITVEQ